MRFVKMHGLGNDYIFFNCMDSLPEDPGGLSRRLSDRHFGVGGDGIICVCPSDRVDFQMRMFNADGSEGVMCGNGIRCFGKYVYDRGLTAKTRLAVETPAGVRELTLLTQGGGVQGATVDMGAPVVGLPVMVEAGGVRYAAVPVSMGNPHAVVEVDDPAALDLKALGPLFERCPVFPHRVNAEFIRVLNRQELELRVWERGSGETLACGTGACAAAAAMITAGRLDREAVVHLAGGDLRVQWEEKSGHMLMTGPAETVFDGELAD